MKRYEYNYFIINDLVTSTLSQMNELGSEGWLLVKELSFNTYLFVREIEDKQPGIAPAKPVEVLSKEQIVEALADILSVQLQESYFHKNGYAGRILAAHLKQLQLELDQQK